MDKDKLKNKLTAEEFSVTQNKELNLLSRKYLNNKDKGVYNCVCCGQELFSSKHKYDSMSGWPSFYDSCNQKNLKLISDKSHGIEGQKLCSNCGSHLGHVFDDGPELLTLDTVSIH